MPQRHIQISRSLAFDFNSTTLDGRDLMAKDEEVRYRSAITGGFVTEEYAKRNPDTTIRDTMKRSPKRRKPKKPSK